MLVLSRKALEKIMLGNDIEIEVVRVAGNRVILGITAPKDVKVIRGELKPETLDTPEPEE